jgi:hypothetical protein
MLTDLKLKTLRAKEIERLAAEHLPHFTAEERTEFARRVLFLLKYPSANSLRRLLQDHDQDCCRSRTDRH